MSLDIWFEEVKPVDVHSQNITHNLCEMAKAVGLYGPLWRPEENGIEHAGQLIDVLESGIAKLKAAPAKYKLMDSPNGWGKYEHFVPWLEHLLEASESYPDAKVRVSV
jgi:hypothetical protein